MVQEANVKERLSYTARDLPALDVEIDKYISSFLPEIKQTSRTNTGRLYLTLIEAIIDIMGFNTDASFLESNIVTAQQLENVMRVGRGMRYLRQGTASAQVDLKFTMITGTAGAGGEAVPLYTEVRTTETPIKSYLTIAAAIILEGQTSVVVPAKQGMLVSTEQLTASASGNPNQVYLLANKGVPADTIEVDVGGTPWTRRTNLFDSGSFDEHYTIVYDAADNTYVIFGDGTFGKIPPATSLIETTYFQSLGADGDAPVNTITDVIGALSSTVTAINDEEASGGSDGDDVLDIKRKAPTVQNTQDRAVSAPDFIALAELVPGVEQAIVKVIRGISTELYVLPEGGGVASSQLLDDVSDALAKKLMLHEKLTVFPLNSANIVIHLAIVTLTREVSKVSVRATVQQAILDALALERIKVGRGFALSDMMTIVEGVNDGELVDFVDVLRLTRVPRVVKSHPSSPDVQGRVKTSSTAAYDTWQLLAITTAIFQVVKNGIVQATTGTIGVEYESLNKEVRFTLGQSTDTLVVGRTWTFETSKEIGNIKLSESEFMSLALKDLQMVVYFPGERSGTEN